MEDENYFNYSASLRIFSESDVDFEEIESVLGVSASMSYRKGDRRRPKGPESRYNIWILESGLSEEECLENHLLALWRVIKPHKDYLKSLKEKAIVDIFCGYRSSSHTAGLEVGYQAFDVFRELEIDFSLSIITL